MLRLWSYRLSRLDHNTQREVAGHLVRFSKRVTETIAKLKDTRIRIWSPEAPDGLFKVAMTDAAYDRLRKSVTPTTTYEEFFDRLVASFWESMEDCLRLVKPE